MYFYLLMRQYHYKYILGDQKPNPGGGLTEMRREGEKEGQREGGGGGGGESG